MKQYHLIGIKGTGMSSLANILFDMGNKVKGSDVEKKFFTQELLEKKGIQINPFSEKNIQKENIIIGGNAFSDSHEEIKQAKNMGNSFYRYHEFLGDFIQDYISIGISGTHGKTTTTGLLSHVLKQQKPTSYLIGDGTGVGEKNSHYFVFEACEYKRHFLAYSPTYAIITNIDFDHPDYYTGIEDVKEAFAQFSIQAKKKVIACGDDRYIQEIKTSQFFTYGFDKKNEVFATDIIANEKGTTFSLYYQNQYYGTYTIPLYGNHQVLNALAVISICLLEGLDIEKVKQSLLTYEGVKRRFQEEIFEGNILIDDYAHHPNEIKATIQAVKVKYPTKDCIAIFQPHTFSRTKTFLTEFAEALSQADMVYLCDIFGSAREKNGDIDIHHLLNLIPNSHYLSYENINQLKNQQDVVLLFMGAGDIQKYQEKLKEKI